MMRCLMRHVCPSSMLNIVSSSMKNSRELHGLRCKLSLSNVVIIKTHTWTFASDLSCSKS